MAVRRFSILAPEENAYLRQNIMCPDSLSVLAFWLSDKPVERLP